jgi:hypothetical protein
MCAATTNLRGARPERITDMLMAPWESEGISRKPSKIRKQRLRAGVKLRVVDGLEAVHRSRSSHGDSFPASTRDPLKPPAT